MDCLDNDEEDVSDMRAVARGPQLRPAHGQPARCGLSELTPRQGSAVLGGEMLGERTPDSVGDMFREAARITTPRPPRVKKASMARGGWGDPE